MFGDIVAIYLLFVTINCRVPDLTFLQYKGWECTTVALKNKLKHVIITQRFTPLCR